MRNAHRVEDVRAAEQELMARLPEGALMQRAAVGLAATCARLLRGGGVRGGGAAPARAAAAGPAPAGPDPGMEPAGAEPAGPGPATPPRRRAGVAGSLVAVLAGSGGNGGDALYAGARLAARGARVHAVLLSPERVHPGGLAALRAEGGRAVPVGDVDPADPADPTVALLRRADLLVDGVVGIGGRGGLREPAAALLRAAGPAPVVAVDVPSGVDADTGAVPGDAVRADVTVTFGTHKPGLLVSPGAEHAGVVQLVDIGLGPHLDPAGRHPAAVAPQAGDVAAVLAALSPAPESDKYRRGVVGVAAGSARYPGAALLAVAGALHGGAGAVRYAGEAAREVVRRHPETLISDGLPRAAGRVQAWVTGPGLARDEHAARIVSDVLVADGGLPKLFDADALALLAERGPDALAGHRRVLLTPHAGEAARLLGSGATAERVEAERVASARELAARYGATVLLKGSTTVVAGPEGPVAVNPTGTGWLATAGSGDVLSGFAGALLAAGLEPYRAGWTAAYLHGLAGRRAAGAPGAPVTATDVAAALPAAWRVTVAAAREG